MRTGLNESLVRVTAASQGAVQGLIELQEEIVTSALTDAAAQFERLAYTKSVGDLARVRAEVLGAARKRIVNDITRTVRSLKGAAGEVREDTSQARKWQDPSSGTQGGEPNCARRAVPTGLERRPGQRSTHRDAELSVIG